MVPGPNASGGSISRSRPRVTSRTTRIAGRAPRLMARRPDLPLSPSRPRHCAPRKSSPAGNKYKTEELNFVSIRNDLDSLFCSTYANF